MKPTGFVCLSTSYRQTRVRFTPNVDGGLQQTITLEKAFSDAPNIFHAVENTGPLPRNDRTTRELTLRNPEEGAKYLLRLKADNAFTEGSAALSEVLEIETPGGLGTFFHTFGHNFSDHNHTCIRLYIALFTKRSIHVFSKLERNLLV